MRTQLSLEPSKKSLVLVGIGCVLGFLLCCAVAIAGYSKTHAARMDLDKKQAQVEDGRQIATRLQDSQRRYTESVEQLRYLEKSVSTRAYIPTLLKQLEAMGKSLNLKVVAVRPIVADLQQKPAPQQATNADKQGNTPDDKTAAAVKKDVKPPYEEQKIDISVEGSYVNALSFLYRLTTFPKILTVNSVEMSPATGGFRGGIVQKGRLDIRFNVTAFILDERNAKVALADATPIGDHRKALAGVGVKGQFKAK